MDGGDGAAYGMCVSMDGWVVLEMRGEDIPGPMNLAKACISIFTFVVVKMPTRSWVRRGCVSLCLCWVGFGEERERGGWTYFGVICFIPSHAHFGGLGLVFLGLLYCGEKVDRERRVVVEVE